MYCVMRASVPLYRRYDRDGGVATRNTQCVRARVYVYENGMT